MKACIIGVDGREIEGTKALLWGNNAAGFAQSATSLLDRGRASGRKRSPVIVGRRHILVSAENQYGEYNQGAAKSVRAL